MSLLDHLLVLSVWRRRRLREMLAALAPQVGESLVDLGGTPSMWQNWPEVTTVRLHVVNLDADSAWARPGLTVERADVRHLSHADRAFAVAFSNSLIEHVGSWADQAAAAREIRRVAQRIWVQTPAAEGWIEPHWVAPLFWVRWFERRPRWRWLLLWLTPRGLMDRAVATRLLSGETVVRLLNRAEMQDLFPDCEIREERWLGRPKSWIAVREKLS